ncbi:MAG: phosphoribosylanthranilate isomerase [Prolixibacteraceae bacterium]|nr:phosphoribosylanthranilate isomerase [Prolixibacteraceae bacterium]MBT6006764.1 phosphoribosylanthranilate isomerase [Prolixibacteraceae bacterium]MBT6766663.1 phosphoribosylanthranilate isomerase [Prolixibacteraceae bacterium]MBT6997124.1 phosphoribosylanthranilate isomerase [Prolixibacteraceae bacterium]MBT7393343.1 phosphoribosylanthranilate isomerase [Prolixibacteraceae bacterium]
MKFTENRQQVEELEIDFLGYIFYPQSKRFIGENPESNLFNSAKPKVSVFVDENVFEILGLAKNLGFEYVQLHGKENPKTCQILKNQGLKVIKAFNVNEKFKFSNTAPFEKVADFFLFDTKTKLPGGSGEKFNWEILKKYNGHTPFFLSGGITLEDAESIKEIEHTKLTGVDLNSGFEDAPGVKDIEKLKTFITELRI